MKLKSGFCIFVLFSIFSLLFYTCSFQESNNSNMGIDSIDVFKGKIVKVNFVDKGGNVHDEIFSWYFEIENERLFIKVQEGKVSSDKIAEFFNEQIEVKGYKSNGLWDTEDPNVQSRIGDYIVFLEIL